MSPVIVTLPARKPNMLSVFLRAFLLAILAAVVDAGAFLSGLRVRTFFGEDRAFFTAVVFLGFDLLGFAILS